MRKFHNWIGQWPKKGGSRKLEGVTKGLSSDRQQEGTSLLQTSVKEGVYNKKQKIFSQTWPKAFGKIVGLFSLNMIPWHSKRIFFFVDCEGVENAVFKHFFFVPQIICSHFLTFLFHSFIHCKMNEKILYTVIFFINIWPKARGGQTFWSACFLPLRFYMKPFNFSNVVICTYKTFSIN